MEFNEEQQRAIHSTARHLLVLAGAGTGKTRTIIGRAGHLIRQGCPPNRIAIITFTRRAASEIRHRLAQDIGEPPKGILAGTFHNFCLREMSARRQWFGLDEITVMDQDDQSQLMKLVRAQLVGKNKDSRVPQSSQLLNYYSYARNTNQPVQEYLERYTELDESTIKLLLSIFEAYRDRKRSAGYVDFDDILHRFAKVMKNEADICQRIASAYEHVLVDEMQDTNPLQWLILESLAAHVNLFCVGDDAQSIYAFRGADFRNVHSFTERLPNAEVLKLELNYRSTQEILDVSNWLLAQSKLEYNKQLRAHRGAADAKPKFIETITDDDEAEWVVGDIVRHHAEGLQWQDQMVLARTARSARSVETELIRRKVPYRFIGGISLLQMAHVKDLLAILRVVVNHRDELAWMRYLMMWHRIGEVTAAKIVQQIYECDNFEQALEQLASRVSRPEIVAPLKIALKNYNRPSECLSQLVKHLTDMMKIRYDNWDTRQRDCELIVRLAERHSNIQTFLDAYALDPVSATDVSQEDDDLLTLITVHSAKGTECKICYVIAAQKGNYPHSRSENNEDDIEEERRVLYVALTRAQDELIISRHWQSRTAWNSWQNSTPGFLDLLPSKLVDQENSTPNPTPNDRHRFSSDYWNDDVI